MPVPSLSSVILRVADIDRALAFWRDRVGLPVHAAGDRAGPDPADGLLALTEVVLEVPDVRTAHAEMAARGVPFRTAPRAVTRQGERELWACDFRDPDGHLASITGWVVP
jgi:catechol 2,3-dioxygenase-like lactoylglutathione lyase family enzyme